MQAKLSVQAEMDMANQIRVPVVKKVFPVRGDYTKPFAAEPLRFVFAHFLVPHPPIVTNTGGTFKTVERPRRSSRRDNYVGQIESTNAAILQLVDHLLAENPNSVIVIQADEGPCPRKYAGDEIIRFGGDVSAVDWSTVEPDDLREKMGILNAVYLPGKPGLVVHDNFSPVNTFRLILREYFEQQLPDLPTKSMVYLSESSVWQFQDVHPELVLEESN